MKTEDLPTSRHNSASRRRLFWWAGAAGVSLVSAPALAQSGAAPRRAGTANFVTGDASLQDADGKRALTTGTVVREGQTLETGADAEVHVVFDDGGYLALRPSSRLKIDQVHIAGAFTDSLAMQLLSGAMRSITGWVGKFDHGSYQLRAGTATVGIRGTDHEVALIADGEARNGEMAGVHNWVNEGGTTLKNAGGQVDIEPGHAAWAAHNGQAPRFHEGGIPAFLQRRRTRFESRVERHAQHIREHIESRMKKRGMLKDGERLEDAQRRHLALRENAPAHERIGERAGERAEERRKRLKEELERRHLRP